MEGAIWKGTTYGRNVRFIRIFFWEKLNKEMIQETNFKPICNTLIIDTWKSSVWNVDWLKVVQICRRSRLFCTR